jgi:hypothetical protein
LPGFGSGAWETTLVFLALILHEISEISDAMREIVIAISGVITTIGHNRLSTSYLGCYQE